jgi:[ribosomal protein S5]-alanine N-acetyltransferase
VFPILETTRLVLRELNEGDLDSVYHIFSNPLVTQYYGQEPIQTLEQSHALLQKLSSIYTEKRGCRWGIERKEDKRLIGTVGFHLWSALHRRAEIGYELHPDAWGKGYASEAMQAILAYGFKEMDLHRIAASVYLENKASNSLLEKFTFQKEGIKRAYMLQGGTFYDTYAYSLLKTDFLGGAANDLS